MSLLILWLIRREFWYRGSVLKARDAIYRVRRKARMQVWYGGLFEEPFTEGLVAGWDEAASLDRAQWSQVAKLSDDGYRAKSW